MEWWEFPGSPVVRTPHSHCWGPKFNPGWGTKIIQAAQCDLKKKRYSSSVCVHAKPHQLCPTLQPPWTVTGQVSLSREFPRQEYWNGLPIPLPGDLPESGIEPTSLVSAGRVFTTKPPGKPHLVGKKCYTHLHMRIRGSGNWSLGRKEWWATQSHQCLLPLLLGCEEVMESEQRHGLKSEALGSKWLWFMTWWSRATHRTTRPLSGVCKQWTGQPDEMPLEAFAQPSRCVGLKGIWLPQQRFRRPYVACHLPHLTLTTSLKPFKKATSAQPNSFQIPQLTD